jgi:Protein of unknown function (DUF3577)
MNANRTQAQAQATESGAESDKSNEYFNLHASGCGYMSRARWVKSKGDGRKAPPFLACAINALRGNVDEPSYTYFDLRVSGDEAVQIVEQLMPAIEKDRKVFVAFKLGDFYAHAYERDMKDREGRKTGEKEMTALIKGRLLLITHAKVDDEVVYQREQGQDDDSGQGDAAGDSGDAPEMAQTPPPPARRASEGSSADSRPPTRPVRPVDRSRVRTHGEAAMA